MDQKTAKNQNNIGKFWVEGKGGIQMKKTILGAITLVTLLVLGACGSSSADTASSGASDATEIKVGTGE